MTPTLQQCRQYYDCIPREMRDKAMSRYLIAAIQIAENYETLLLQLAEAAQAFRDRVTTEGIELHRLDAVLEKVAKPEGE